MSRVKRLLTRALLVTGGALAGTAAVWALSSAPASAQEADHAGAFSAVTEAVARGPVGEAVAPVRETVRDLDARVRAERADRPAPPDLGRVADGLRDAFGHTVSWFESNPAAPVLGSPLTGRIVNRHTEPAPEAAAVPVSIGTPVVWGAFGKLSESWSSSSALPLGVPADEVDTSLPGGPAKPPLAPFAPPAGVPVHCTCGGDGSGSAAGGNGPFTGVSTDDIDAAAARALLPGTDRHSVMPGKQPGITPD